MHFEKKSSGLYLQDKGLCVWKKAYRISKSEFLYDASGKEVHKVLGHRNIKNKLTSETILQVYIKMSC